tara:strand:- start:15 stop:257 length:243 start_codon:yes stop_codon:yes gene_type:complete
MTDNRITEDRVNEKLNQIISLLKGKTHADNKWIDIREAAKYASVSKTTIRRALKDKKLNASSSTGKHLFKIDDIERWLTK